MAIVADNPPYAVDRGAESYPLSRWYLRPAAGLLSLTLVETGVRPSHLTIAGLTCGLAAACFIVFQPGGSLVGAALVLVAWFFDRADGLLARRQGTASAWGRWLDANVDELLDVAWHAALAIAAASVGAAWAWPCLIAFLTGKYLFMYGLWVEEGAAPRGAKGDGRLSPGHAPTPGPSRGGRGEQDDEGRGEQDQVFGGRGEQDEVGVGIRVLRRLYHLPANADVRLHVLAAAICLGWYGIELALVAAYYNLRWAARYSLVARRLREHAP